LTQDDALYRFRVRVFALAEETGNVRSACRAMGIHPSTFYRWRKQVHRFGLEILHPRERRRPRMANATSPLMEQRILAFALAHPTVGPQRISDELRRRKWGGFMISPNGVHKVLRRHGLNTKAKRLGLVAGYAAPAEPIEKEPQPERHIDVSHPGELVQMDCFTSGACRGRAARCGSTPRSTWRARMCGPSYTSRPETPRRAEPRPWRAGWRGTWPRADGSSRR
jgi:transposase